MIHNQEEEHTRNTTNLLKPQACVLLQASFIKATPPNPSQTVPSIQIYEPIGPVIIQITTTIKGGNIFQIAISRISVYGMAAPLI